MSADCDAPAPVTAAAMRFVPILPGARPPYTSCVTLPMPPTGLISVSPVERTATAASANESAKATTVRCIGISNRYQATMIVPTAAKARPVRHHAVGMR